MTSRFAPQVTGTLLAAALLAGLPAAAWAGQPTPVSGTAATTTFCVAQQDDFGQEVGTRFRENAGGWVGIGIGAAAGAKIGFVVTGGNPFGMAVGGLLGAWWGQAVGETAGRRMVAPAQRPYAMPAYGPR